MKDEWADRKQLAIQHVTLRPLQLPTSAGHHVAKVLTVREPVQRFPENSELQKVFHPSDT
jgi:hypothetical protein